MHNSTICTSQCTFRLHTAQYTWELRTIINLLVDPCHVYHDLCILFIALFNCAHTLVCVNNTFYSLAINHCWILYLLDHDDCFILDRSEGVDILIPTTSDLNSDEQIKINTIKDCSMQLLTSERRQAGRGVQLNAAWRALFVATNNFY